MMSNLKQILIVGNSELRDSANEIDAKRYECFITDSTQEAKALIAHHRIDLVVSDYSLSKRRLISLQRQVKKNKGTVIIYTGECARRPSRQETGSVARLASGELCITKDITNLQSLPQVIEQALFNPEDYFTFEEPAQPHVVAILESTTDFVGTMDIDGFFVYLNQKAKDVLEIGPYGADKPVRIHDILDRESAARLRKDGMVAAMTDGTWRDSDATVEFGSELFPASLQLIAHRDEMGNLTHFSTIVRDLTDIRNAEKERLKLLSQLQDAQKMESIGELSAALSHNFGNILNGVMGYAELGLQSSNPEQQLKSIMDTCVTGSSIVKQLMSVASPEKSNLNDLNANQLLEGIKDLLQTIVGNHVVLNLNLGHELHAIGLDSSALQQIVLNLCSNARDAIHHSDGRINITTQNCKGATFSGAEGVTISISDNGTGMDEETCRNVFTPFYSTKGDKGTGLGLSYVHEIVSEAGGNITVASKPGCGSTFKLFIPRSHTTHPETAAEVIPTEQRERSSFFH